MPSLSAGRFLAAQQHPPAAVGVEPHPGEFPAAVLGLDRQPGRCADPGQVRWQPQRYPLVFVGQVVIPSRWHPAAVHRPSSAHRRTGDHLHTRSRARHHIQGARCFVEGQGVGLLHGSITHLLDGYTGGQIVTNDGIGCRLRHPGQPRSTRPARTGRRAPGSADAGSAGRCRTPAARRRGCRRPAPGRPDRRPSWWRLRRPAARVRRRLRWRRRWSPTSARGPARRPYFLVRQGHPPERRSSAGRRPRCRSSACRPHRRRCRGPACRRRGGRSR